MGSYRHGIAMIVLYNKEGKMLLEHRTETRKAYPGCWGLFGGHLEERETPEEGARREAMEELGYTLSEPVLIHTEPLHTNSDKYAYVFVEAYAEKQSIVLHPWESQDYGWFTLEEAKNLPNPVPHNDAPLEAVWEYIQKRRS